jgi:hypothetical protein
MCVILFCFLVMVICKLQGLGLMDFDFACKVFAVKCKALFLAENCLFVQLTSHCKCWQNLTIWSRLTKKNSPLIYVLGNRYICL